MGVGPLKRAVFFDRDGVLNEANVRNGVPHPPATVADLHIAGGAAGVVRAVRDAGFLAIVITNQPDVARGTTTLVAVDAINAEIVERLGVDATYTCPHDDAAACDCRKPKPGLLQRAARDHGIDLAASFMVGDRTKDVACGHAAGCTTIFLDHGYGETKTNPGADHTIKTLAELPAIVAAGAALHREPAQQCHPEPAQSAESKDASKILSAVEGCAGK
jgi:D-glycero-D-manno-heptose 1,7-bisphosphate phosphatase